MIVMPPLPAEKPRDDEWSTEIKERITKLNRGKGFDDELERAKKQVNEQRQEAEKKIKKATNEAVYSLCCMRNSSNVRVSNNYLDYISKT